uniref:Uncharacterized protein n=1 Tax=Varanus komodoensis TaxID=61221 RepID=A0A8D2J7T5_VARKO
SRGFPTLLFHCIMSRCEPSSILRTEEEPNLCGDLHDGFEDSFCLDVGEGRVRMLLFCKQLHSRCLGPQLLPPPTCMAMACNLESVG